MSAQDFGRLVFVNVHGPAFLARRTKAIEPRIAHINAGEAVTLSACRQAHPNIGGSSHHESKNRLDGTNT
jgi:hypothetical protein